MDGDKVAKPKGGRPKGAASMKTRAIADQAAREGITPLEVMIKIMRMRWEACDFDGALAAAVDAAPYMHSRLASTTIKGEDGPITINVVSYADAVAAVDQIVRPVIDMNGDE